MDYLFIAYLLLLCFFLQRTTGYDFSYSDSKDWKLKFPKCDGRRQSPIALNYSKVLHMNLPPLSFMNYDMPLVGHVKVNNNGHTVQINIPITNDQYFPYIYGGGLDFIYRVKNIHFHWGSAGVPGSEHSINGKRYDLELHIVHLKFPYYVPEQAMSDPDGFVVLSVLFQGEQDDDIQSNNLSEFFEALPYLSKCKSTIELQVIKMEQFLGELNTEEFYLYEGSLTTPPCSETAIWIVFPDVLSIEYRYLQKFWHLYDSKSELLLHNQRTIQPNNSRKVYYRRANRRACSVKKSKWKSLQRIYPYKKITHFVNLGK